jgi:hypothetical protein
MPLLLNINPFYDNTIESDSELEYMFTPGYSIWIKVRLFEFKYSNVVYGSGNYVLLSE